MELGLLVAIFINNFLLTVLAYCISKDMLLQDIHNNYIDT
jgi:hypothetical protein